MLTSGRQVGLEAARYCSLKQPTGSEFINRHPATLLAGDLLGRQKMRALIVALVASIAVTALTHGAFFVSKPAELKLGTAPSSWQLRAAGGVHAVPARLARPMG